MGDSHLIPVVLDGASVHLDVRVYKPVTEHRVSTLVFHHGSTGDGREPNRFIETIDYPAVGRFFAERGWAVIMPARRGRGRSEGVYDEGFGEDRSRGYTGDPAHALAGADRALRDIEAVMETVVTMPFVDRDRLVIGGQSRGGILSVAYAGRHPEQVTGVINFVGGWLGTRHATASLVNQTLFSLGSVYSHPTLWLYGADDPFYPLAHSRENFAAFQSAGGRGIFHAFTPPRGVSGHHIWAHPGLWGDVIIAYLMTLGLPIPLGK